MKKLSYREAIITILVIIMGMLFAAIPSQADAAGKIVVTDKYANVRSSAKISSKMISKVFLGETYSIVKQSQGWYYIQLRNGQKGWVAGWLVKPAPEKSKQVSSQSKLSTKSKATQVSANSLSIKGDFVNLRSGPATSYALAGKVKKGETIQVIRKEKDWYQVKLNKGQTGWVAGWLVAEVTQSKPTPTVAQIKLDSNNNQQSTGSGQATIKGDFVNVRSGPATSFTLLGKVQKGETIKIINGEKEWFQIRLIDGKIGWVASWLVAETTQEKAVPIPSQTKLGTGNTASDKPTGNNAGQGSPESTNGSGSAGTSTGASTAAGTLVSNVNNGTSTETEIDNTGNSNGNGNITGNSLGVENIQLPCPARISSSTVNFRSGPGSETAVVSKLAQGTRVEALRQDGSWLEVKLIDGSVGWVASWLVKFIGKTNLLEIGIDIGEQNKITILGSEPLVYEINEQQQPNRLVVKIRDAELAGNAQDIAVGQSGLVKVSTGAVEGDNTSVQVNLELETGFRWVTKPGDNERMLLIVPTDSKVGDVRSETGQNGTNSENSQGIHTVAIDPGHGGIDPGAAGVNKLQEKDVVFDISKRVGLKLESAGYRVIYTRTDDTKIPLTRRPAIALENKADIFVSIHANSSENSSTNGTSTYYYAPSSIPNLAAQGSERLRLARAVQNQMIKAVGRKDLGIKQENFSVLRGTTMPSILVETAYLSYREEEALLAQEEIREKFAQAIFEGIKQYFAEYQPTG